MGFEHGFHILPYPSSVHGLKKRGEVLFLFTKMCNYAIEKQYLLFLDFFFFKIKISRPTSLHIFLSHIDSFPWFSEPNRTERSDHETENRDENRFFKPK